MTLFAIGALGVLLGPTMAGTVSAASASSPAAADDALERRVETAGNALFTASGAPGMVMAVVQNDTLVVRGFGETRPGSGQRPTGTTIVRVGSVSKVLAGELLATLADRGTLRLTDPLQRYAPSKRVVPQTAGKPPITLLSLATHTSGLARMVDPPFPPGLAPFSFPDHARRWDWLASTHPATIPGADALYSNVAYDLLGDAMAAAAKQPYDELLRTTITAPLKMVDTTATPSAAQCARLMEGREDSPSGPCADTRATAASGGLYSTANDIGTWMRHLLAIDTPPSSFALRSVAQATYVSPQSLTSVTGLDFAGTPTGLGLGWVQLSPGPDSPVILEKTGGGGGFLCYLAFTPGRRSAVFVAVTMMELERMKGMTRDVNELVLSLATPRL